MNLDPAAGRPDAGAMLDGIETGYEAKFDFPRRERAPERPYLLATVPRSGSTYVSHLLWATGCLGAPLSGIWRAEQERGGRAEPEYSAVAVERAGKLIEAQESAWAAMSRDLGIAPLELWYEDVLSGPEAAIAAVAGYLGVELDPAAAVDVPAIERQSQQGADAWKDRHAGG